MGQVRLAPRDHTLPSISIESDTSLELTEELVTQAQDVEPYDALLARAAGSNNTREGVIIIHSDDESLDGETVLMDSLEQPEECGRGAEEGEAVVGDGGGVEPTDSVRKACRVGMRPELSHVVLQCSKSWRRRS